MPVAHPKDVLQRYDVLVAQKLYVGLVLTKDVQLSENTFGIDRVVENVGLLLDGDCPTC